MLLPIGTSFWCTSLTEKSVYEIWSFFAHASQTYSPPIIRASTVLEYQYYDVFLFARLLQKIVFWQIKH